MTFKVRLFKLDDFKSDFDFKVGRFQQQLRELVPSKQAVLRVGCHLLRIFSHYC